MTGRVLAAWTSAVGFAGVVIYLSTINAQDGEISTAACVWATAMAMPATLALGSVLSLVDSRMRQWLLGIAAVVNGALGIIGIFSVGIIFVVAGFLAAFGAALSSPNLRTPSPR